VSSGAPRCSASFTHLCSRFALMPLAIVHVSAEESSRVEPPMAASSDQDGLAGRMLTSHG
jgi:hypothetical protein